MAISYKDDHGADLMDFGIIDWFGSGGNGGAAGGGAFAGAGGAIGSAAALLIAIGKEKWEKLYGGMDKNSPFYIPPPEDIPSGPPANDTPGTPSVPGTPSAPAVPDWTPGLTIPDKGNDLPGQVIPDTPGSDLPGLTHDFDLSGNKTWESFWQEGIKMGPETFGGFAPGITQEDINKGKPTYKVGEDGKFYITIQEEEASTPSTGDGESEIKPEEEKVEDNTFANIENAITPFDPLKWAEEQQMKMWEREDAIRLETQQREDTAYQRAIEDMQRAGINPNLMGSITPAGSGGGITNATPADTALAQKQMEKDMELLKQSIDLAFKEDQNQKDRVWNLITKILGAGAMLGSAAIR